MLVVLRFLMRLAWKLWVILVSLVIIVVLLLVRVSFMRWWLVLEGCFVIWFVVFSWVVVWLILDLFMLMWVWILCIEMLFDCVRWVRICYLVVLRLKCL